jgi:LacI family transcriptional regulator
MTEKKVTMKDIASELNISINAVSLALNNKTGVSDDMRIKVLRLANETGYLRNSSKFIRTFSRTNLCIMMQKMYSTDMNFYGKVLYSVVEESKKNGYDTILNFFDDDEMIVPNCVEECRVAGVIVIGKINDRNIEDLKDHRIPIILVDHASLFKSINCVLTDNKLGGFVMTKYLIEKGFRKIGFFGDLNYSLSIKERYFGFMEAVDTCGCYQEEGSLGAYIEAYSITHDIERAVLANDNKIIKKLIEEAKHLPEAFVCSNDKVAIALLMVLQALGYKVPEDISLVGFDNIDMCEKVTPKLTTANVNKEKMGKRAVERILYLIDHQCDSYENIILSVELIERESVKTPQS